MSSSDSDGLAAARAQLVSYSARLLADGLAIGSAGNMSVRAGDAVAITPSGITYAEMRPEDVCVVAMDGTELDNSETPSSETPMHLAIYAATNATAVVHTHSPEVIALSASRPELPAIHYAITGLGGPVRVAPYVRFGSAGLAAAAVGALNGRSAVILRNHGAVTYGRDLAQAYDRALLLEWLARTYRMALSYGEPATLSAAELDEVTAETRRRRYGERRGIDGFKPNLCRTDRGSTAGNLVRLPAMRRHHHRPAHRRPRQPAPEDAGPPPQPRPATRLRPEPDSRLGRRAPGRRPPRAPGNRSLAPHVTTPPRPTAEPSRAEPRPDRPPPRPRVGPDPVSEHPKRPRPPYGARVPQPSPIGAIYGGLCAPSPKRERPARPRIRAWATVLPAQDSRPRTSQSSQPYSY